MFQYWPLLDEITIPSGSAGIATGEGIIVVTTPVVAANGRIYVTVPLGPLNVVMAVRSSNYARIRLYQTSAYQVADASRIFNTISTANDNGILADWYLNTSAELTYNCSLPPIVINGDVPQSTNIYMTVDNLTSTTQSFVITFIIYNTLASLPVTGTYDWANILNKPSLFPADTTGFATRLNLNFTYDSPSPLTIGVITGRILEVRLFIDTPWNGSGASITIGDNISTDILMTNYENDPYTKGSYETHPTYQYTVATSILLTLISGSSTQGSGSLVIDYK